MEKHKRINITLPMGLALELDKMALELNDKKSRIIAQALELYFDEMDTKIAESRLKSGSLDLIDSENVWAELSI